MAWARLAKIGFKSRTNSLLRPKPGMGAELALFGGTFLEKSEPAELVRKQVEFGEALASQALFVLPGLCP